MNTKHPFETVESSADVMKLAEMILSDCGQSTVISDRLQRRVAGRIQQHMDSAAQKLQCQVDTLLAAMNVIALGELPDGKYANISTMAYAEEAYKAAQRAPIKDSLTTDRQAEPVAWVRFCSDGCYEGPLMNSSPAMDGARRTSGAWTPLFAAQLVARDVLMAAMRAAVAECAEICDVYSSYKGARCASEIRHPIMNSKLADIADRYAAQPPAVAEGCGACGEGCQGQGCRLERESPPTCQACNGKGMIGGLLPNGGGYDGEPCPDCSAPQATAEESSVVQAGVAVPAEWPTAQDVGRIGDMSQVASLRVGLDADNDVYVSIANEEGMADVEFCVPGNGGGKSPRTRAALIALMVAMEADNAESPSRDWWKAREGDAQKGGAA